MVFIKFFDACLKSRCRSDILIVIKSELCYAPKFQIQSLKIFVLSDIEFVRTDQRYIYIYIYVFIQIVKMTVKFLLDNFNTPLF